MDRYGVPVSVAVVGPLARRGADVLSVEHCWVYTVVWIERCMRRRVEVRLKVCETGTRRHVEAFVG